MVKIFRDTKEMKKGVEFLFDDARNLFPKNIEISKIYEGCLWAEGPIFLQKQNIIVWSDIPYNRMLFYNLSDSSTGVYRLSLIHISEPTRRTPISYDVY